ncbi:class II aldolase/adducin family protein [Gabonibacter chumensis]|uniref:class II aldolase/adducin family protein n=1 Tax=Gabonibacter chumensis TaxID=2972474 RepID=UPI00257448A3|nr:class II aldolase/adducin family protein [Gabonibacter chumensis]MCR9010927.1 class II aldolase/adducin family protein [Gabonibacter chumensis]
MNLKNYSEIFYAEEIERLKELICDIGRRMWQRNYVDGNGGNISVRLNDSMVLCTPTYISKGFMKPEDMCMVDMQGRQLAGERPSTSEIKTHLAIMRRNPSAWACVHAHPPYTTSFALCGHLPKEGVVSEAEIFLGELGLASYARPGSREIEEAVDALALGRNAIIMQGHGAITWGKSVEEAYWKLENLEAYCQVVHLAECRKDILISFSEEERKDLKRLREKFEQ